jgi:hypothetical protein
MGSGLVQGLMSPFFLFIIIWAAMVANSFWEAYVEAGNPFDRGKLGWKLRYRGRVVFTAYHFWLFVVMWPLLLAIPFVLFGFDRILFLIVASAYISGLVIEDFFWFVVHPDWKMKDWNSKRVTWYPWFKIGRFEFPRYYVLGILLSVILLLMI